MKNKAELFLHNGNDYVFLKGQSIEHRIKGIVGWHEYDFNILAFLIKKLYE